MRRLLGPVVLLALVASNACVTSSIIGPFVKSVTRSGPALVVESCEIVLERGKLHEGTCQSQIIRLDSGVASPPPLATPAPSAPQGASPANPPGLPSRP